MIEIFSDPNAWLALITLVALEIVLGIDNIIFISILTNRLPQTLRSRARTTGLGLAMMMRIGLDLKANNHDPETQANLQAVRSRCLKCTAEDYCERWLDSEVSGDNDFCPNAQTFRDLKWKAPPKSTTAQAL